MRARGTGACLGVPLRELLINVLAGAIRLGTRCPGYKGGKSRYTTNSLRLMLLSDDNHDKIKLSFFISEDAIQDKKRCIDCDIKMTYQVIQAFQALPAIPE